MTWIGAAKIAFVVAFPLALVPALGWAERRLSALIQGRLGPNRVNLPLVGRLGGLLPGGLGQSLADAIKFIFKEDVIPNTVDRFLYVLAPVLVFLPPMLGLLVIPFSNQYGDEAMIGARLPIGILFLMSVLSIGVYGIAFGGWASNSKFSLLGGLRASAQMISYELTMGLTIVTVIMIAGSVDPVEIVQRQAGGAFLFGWNVFGGGNLLLVPSGIVALILLYTASLAENNRLPFDLPECEAELVAGYHTEYSSMKFALFMMGEYVGMIMMSALIVTMLLGGWHFPGLTDPMRRDLLGGVLIPFGVWVSKVLFILLLTMQVRWTLPRFKYSQLMDLGWRVLVPIALVNLCVVGVIGVAMQK